VRRACIEVPEDAKGQKRNRRLREKGNATEGERVATSFYPKENGRSRTQCCKSGEKQKRILTGLAIR